MYPAAGLKTRREFQPIKWSIVSTTALLCECRLLQRHVNGWSYDNQVSR